MNEKVHMLSEDTETIWRYSKYHIGEWVEVETTDKKIMHWYDEYCLRYPDYCKLAKEDAYSMTFIIDPKCMGFKPRAPRKGPTLTEEQKEANKKRLSNLRK